MNVLMAKEVKGELTERQQEKLAALRSVLVKDAIAAALKYEAEVPRRSARLAAKPSVSYADLGDEEVEEAPPTVGPSAPRRSARLAAKPSVSYAAGSTVGQRRYEEAVAGLLALRSAGM